MLKDEFMALVNRSDRTVDLWVKSGRVERQVVDNRAYFRMARPPPGRNAAAPRDGGVTPGSEGATAAELLDALRENTRELRALRETMERREAAPLLSEGGATPRNAPQRDNALLRLWKRFVYGQKEG